MKKFSIGNPLDLIPGGGPVSKVIWGAVLLFAFIYVVQSGLVRIGMIATRDTIAIVGPDTSKAVSQFGEYLPGAPRVEVVIGSNTYTLFGGKDPGNEYAAIWGASMTGSGSNFGSGGTAPLTIEQLTQRYYGQAPTDVAAKQKMFQDLVNSLIGLVGGQFPTPDFSSLEAYEVITARTTIAAMQALSYDTVNPPKWGMQLEVQIAKNYTLCFQRQDFACVEQWGPVQVKPLTDPDGLRIWMEQLLSANPPSFNKLVRLAIGTNASEIGQELVAKAFNAAKAKRIVKAKQNADSAKATPIDIQWIFGGQVVSVRIDEGFQLPAEVGGGRGKLNADDKVFFTDASGYTVEVNGDIARVAVPSLTVSTTQAQFSPLPVLWDQAIQAWQPGQELP